LEGRLQNTHNCCEDYVALQSSLHALGFSGSADVPGAVILLTSRAVHAKIPLWRRSVVAQLVLAWIGPFCGRFPGAVCGSNIPIA